MRNSPLSWLRPLRRVAWEEMLSPTDRTVERAVRWLTLLAAAIANVIGTIAVFVLLVGLLPTAELAGDRSPVIVNLAMAAGYVLLAVPIGMVVTLRRLRSGRTWLKEGRAPTYGEQRNLLRAPLHVFATVGIGWIIAALLFGAYNATFSFELGQRVAITVALGGLVTCTTAYLITERLLRPAAARALSARPLEEPALPGVTARAMFAWGVGSAVPLLGLVLIALSTLIEGDFSRSELAVAVLGLAAGALVLGCWLALFAARVTTAPINSMRAGVDEIGKGNLEAEVPVYDGTEVGLLQAGFNRMAAGIRERERIRELFGMHVGEEVARAALERESGLGGETREVGVLFVDIVSSTAIAAERPPGEVVDLLNEFFSLVVEVVEEHGGWVNKFEGDAALAVFGAPEPLDDASGCALGAGRELAGRLREELGSAEAGIGISYGQVVAGNVGSSHRFEYTVIGDAVNEAARLTELAKGRPTMILASEPAVSEAGEEEAGRWSLDGEVELRGRGRPTRVAQPSDQG